MLERRSKWGFSARYLHIFVVFKNETATNIILKMLQKILATEYRNNTYFRFIKKIEGFMKISDKVPNI